MKAEIRQVLQMNREGTLTDEQAAELLTELTRKEAERIGGERASKNAGLPIAQTSHPAHLPQTPQGRLDHIGMMDSIFCKVNTTVKYALDGAFGREGMDCPVPGTEAEYGSGSGNEGGGSGRNHIHMSKFDQPQGREHIFTGNTVRMSSLKDLCLVRAEMIDNIIDMSKVAGVSVQDGKIIACGIRASSVDDWRVEGATVRAMEISGSKVSGLFCGGGSVVRGARVQSASLKDFRIQEGSKAADLVLNATALAHAKLIRSSLAGCEFHGSHAAGLSAEDCAFRNLMLRMMNLKQAAFTRCVLTDTVFSGGERWSWRKQGFRDARFEDCRLENVLFADCRLTNVTLRNVVLRDRQIRGLELSDMILDGSEAFLKAAGYAS